MATGQKIAEAQGAVSVPLHASISGKVVAIEPRPHVSGRLEPAIVIESDGADRRAPDLAPAHKVEELTADQIKDLMKAAGLVGMGGLPFQRTLNIARRKPKRPTGSIVQSNPLIM